MLPPNDSVGGSRTGHFDLDQKQADFHPAAQVHRAGTGGMLAVTNPTSPPNPLLSNAYSASANGAYNVVQKIDV